MKGESRKHKVMVQHLKSEQLVFMPMLKAPEGGSATSTYQSQGKFKMSSFNLLKYATHEQSKGA